MIRKLADGGEMSIILVEQFYDFAEELADGYTVMARGQVIANGIGSEMPEKGIRELVAIWEKSLTWGLFIAEYLN